VKAEPFSSRKRRRIAAFVQQIFHKQRALSVPRSWAESANGAYMAVPSSFIAPVTGTFANSRSDAHLAPESFIHRVRRHANCFTAAAHRTLL
jgi:hypothetical protein